MKKFFFAVMFFSLSGTGLSMPVCNLIAVPEGYRLHVSLSAPHYCEEKVKLTREDGIVTTETYYRISIPGFANTTEKGKPTLATSAFKLAIENELPNVTLSDIVEEKITLAHKIYPSQGAPWYGASEPEKSFWQW